MSTSETQIKNEIARLTATISQHKLGYVSKGPPHTGRSNVYINPNYKTAPNKYVRPGLQTTTSVSSTSTRVSTPVPMASASTSSTQTKEVVLGGVAFEASARSLVRKDLPKPPSSSGPPKAAYHRQQQQQEAYVRKSGHLIPSGRTYKPKSRRGGRNMTLTNTRRPYPCVGELCLDGVVESVDCRSGRRASAKRQKYSDKPCPRFTTTGSCGRGLTCMYQHDPSKIAICWNFLQGNCTKTAETCDLSHDPTPERTPLCLHFLNKGRCTRQRCPFPHVNVGTRQGVCRDFAVLGYCERGLDCDKQHVRECPDFAEKGTCSTKGCKLPHVIRANRNRKVVEPPTAVTTMTETPASGDEERVTAEAGQLGDEYISLTFNESDDSDSEEEESEEEDSSEEGST
ncbi:uncharacterized protein LACBIDRAFT_305355 [Laccaria bicolor S238N-H82]|uniref:Predicted protein n=1 Tax=Laccaria bicolor (strain S238N-H82 / ATCC MYA-4686) TaxID=486041 RepID=B0CU12_LACBS|nr:uncharacterized protein LACBIDRAFT_305355 [Laccaria bicolor S238N-H82]EDR14011.1 predicted protein [Laccaria bicolor S238N-H82]|eukprot:XP_001874570.1 predicted protein [Laccaria bicolor S238N-H82]